MIIFLCWLQLRNFHCLGEVCILAISNWEKDKNNFVLLLEKLTCRKYNSHSYSVSKLECTSFASNSGILKAVVPIFSHSSYSSWSRAVNVTAVGWPHVCNVFPPIKSSTTCNATLILYSWSFKIITLESHGRFCVLKVTLGQMPYATCCRKPESYRVDSLLSTPWPVLN